MTETNRRSFKSPGKPTVNPEGRFILTCREGRDVKIPIDEYRREMLQRVVREAGNLQDFRQLWIEARKRRELINHLLGENYSPEVLRELEDMQDFDYYDMFAHHGYHAQALKCQQRGLGYLKQNQTWFDTMPADAVIVLKGFGHQFGLGGTDALETSALWDVPEISLAGGAAQPNLSINDLKALLVPNLSSDKQNQIAANLKAQLAEVETARNALEVQKKEIVNLANAYIRESIEQSSNTVGAGLARDSGHSRDLSDAVTHSRARPAPTFEIRLGDVLEEVKQGIGQNWADYPVLGATRNGLAPAKEPPGKYPQRYKPVFSGTVFYNPMRIMIGSIASVDDDDEPGITSPDYVALRGKAGVVDSRWFYYWLRSPYGVQCINSLARGAVRERMLFNRLAEGSILLPPYEEQLKALVQLKSVKSGIQKQLDELNKIPERMLAQVFENND